MSQIDDNPEHDHTYYGNGSDARYPAGSATTGSSRVTTTTDSETQSIGVYYIFQAATSGSGGALSENNSNAPDSFCPSGWQLPYSGDGGNYYNKSKSFLYLATTYNLIDNDMASSTKIRSYPLSYLFAGHYNWSLGALLEQGVGGHWWTNTIFSDQNIYDLGMNSSRIWRQGTNIRFFGSSLRWSSNLLY